MVIYHRAANVIQRIAKSYCVSKKYQSILGWKTIKQNISHFEALKTKIGDQLQRLLRLQWRIYLRVKKRKEEEAAKKKKKKTTTGKKGKASKTGTSKSLKGSMSKNSSTAVGVKKAPSVQLGATASPLPSPATVKKN